jgi:tRNA 5-methylaminomethyl-2-thiouridine biosynthesis bifunctional protein
MQVIKSAQIHYNDQGTPVSDVFDDVYFSNESGLEETRYVFLQQNGLPERWAQHQASFFHIIETGFGTGLNFLLAWQHFRLHRQQQPTALCQRLYFSTFEKYPLQLADLRQALQRWPTLAELAQQLLAQYPLALPGCHRLQFEQGSITLDLWLGDVHDSMPQLPAQNQADAWFLDGFAPSKNPQMWQPELFSQMARLSKPGSTVATFTSAGFVRRGLQDAGFNVKKIKGYGRKREMTVGSIDTEHTPLALANYATAMPAQHHNSLEPVTIIGGGLASICLALALQQRGCAVELLCQDADIALQASHNRQGALYPQLQASYSPVSALHSHAFTFASRFYRQLQQQFHFGAEFCGVLTLACTSALASRQQKISAEPAFAAGLFLPLDASQASAQAGLALPYPGLFFPAGGWIAPQAFCQAALAFLRRQANFKVQFNCQLQQLSVVAAEETDAGSGGWRLQTNDGELLRIRLVLANGTGLTALTPAAHLPLHQVRGQVSHVKAPAMAALRTVLCHQGYITPAVEQEHCVGATFDRSRTTAIELAADNQYNLDLVNTVLQQPAWFSDASVVSAKAGVRVTVPDHLPLAGELSAGLFVLGGLGARGLLFAPILAEQLAAQLCAEPLPLPKAMSAMVSPQRFDSKKTAG